MSLPRLDQPFVIGSVATPAGILPRVSSSLTSADHWGTIKARSRIGRMNYTVDPGLYALGEPDDNAPVLVSANYKMSFDKLREALPGRDAWILVLDTKGINVWCAAGKRTFGTTELVERVESSGVAKVVSHRRLILPQLSAPGVAAHEVKKLSGFKVTYGPVRSTDLPTFMDSGFKATPEMRRKTFTLWERVELIPVELVGALQAAVVIVPLFVLLSGLGGPGNYWSNVMDYGLFAAAALISALVAGTILAPILLPWLPGRAFAWKGLTLGLLTALIVVGLRGAGLAHSPDKLEILAWLLIVPAATTYLTVSFTGASTYTSLSGVKKEMRWALPLEIGAASVGIVLWLGSRLTA